MNRWRRVQAWMRAHRREYRAVSAEIDRLRDVEMAHPEDRASVSEWGGLG